jgi:hypothetical protein
MHISQLRQRKPPLVAANKYGVWMGSAHCRRGGGGSRHMHLQCGDVVGVQLDKRPFKVQVRLPLKGRSDRVNRLHAVHAELTQALPGFESQLCCSC